MKRKHLWFPCGIGDEPLGEWSAEDYEALLRETDWQKWITNGQWEVLVNEAGGPNRSKLKRRAAEWMVSLRRIHNFDKQLYQEASELADEIWLRFWAIQAWGREGVTMDLSTFELDDCINAISERRKQEAWE